MNPKNALTLGLLLFVAASIVVLTVKSLRSNPDAAAGTSTSGPAVENPPPAAADGVVVYYMHGNMRCLTCRNIEAYAHEAVEQGFADELAAGTVTWKAVNYDQPGNRHYATDYELVAPTVLVVERKGGEQVNHKNLMRVWELVGDKPAFLAFVRGEVRESLATVGG